MRETSGHAKPARVVGISAGKKKVIGGLVDLVDRQVASKKGLSGAAIKTGFAVVQKVRPGIVEEAVDWLFPDFTKALDPLYQSALADAEEGVDGGEKRVGSHLIRAWDGKRAEVADALLSVTDQRISTASSGVQKVYRRLRGSASDHVSEAVPEIAKVLSEFV